MEFYSRGGSPRPSEVPAGNPRLEPLERQAHKSREFLVNGERWTGGGWRTVASIVYCLAQFLVAVPDAVLGPTLTALGHQVSCAEEGEICPAMLEAIGWNRTGAAVSVILAWILSQCINGHYVLAMGFSMVSASFLVAPFSTTPYMVHVSFFFIGLGKGLASLNSTALMVALRQGNPKKLSKWVNLLSIFWGLGSIFTPLLVSLTTLKDFRLSFFTVAVIRQQKTDPCYHPTIHKAAKTTIHRQCRNSAGYDIAEDMCSPSPTP
uniref:Major facilitator superfamily (MFS) profile domain-containing protein n=1 Tax=Lotharella globosa TaxID=91324 RepID=A0A7S3YS92_9EUKA